MLLVTLCRVAATYGVFTHTVDEPAHVYAGERLLATGRAEIDLVHAPLARLAVALGPSLLRRDDPKPCALENCTGSRYWRMLAAARAGNLPFLVVLLATIWLWGWRIGGPATAIFSTLLLANLPPVLAHAGLATTDLAGAATLNLALFLFTLWREAPSATRAAALGLAAALAVGSKLSALAFLPASMLAIAVAPGLLGCAAPSPPLSVYLRHGALGLMVMLGALWSIYGLTLNPLDGPDGIIAAGPPLLSWRIFPLVELARGIELLVTLNAQAEPNYFMGEIVTGGKWYFFPVMLAVKTPLPFLALLACGGATIPRWRAAALAPALAAAAILLIGMVSGINLGLRHILAFYPLASLVAGNGAAALLANTSRLGRVAAAALCLWLLLAAALAHPDYLAYFNEPARADAAYFSADSDFDWGQDAGRLAAALEQRHITELSVALSSAVKLAHIAPLDAADLWPGQPVRGWVAASIGRILDDRVAPSYLGLRWLACERPVALIGKTILLYDIDASISPVANAACGWRYLGPAPHVRVGAPEQAF